MTIGRFQIIVFKNIKLGSEYGKPVNKFYFKRNKRGVSVNFLGWCMMITKKRLHTYSSGKPISIEQFKKLMTERGVDFSKSTPVEISINGVQPLQK